MRSRKLPPLLADVIVFEYLKGVDVRQLAVKHHACSDTITRLLVNAGVAGTLDRRCHERRRGLQTPQHWGESTCRELTTEQWAYLAGIFDGEGNISYKEGHGYRLAIAQKQSTGLCSWLRDLLGMGTVSAHTQPRANVVENLRIQKQADVICFLKGIAPYVYVKREAVVKATAYYNHLLQTCMKYCEVS